MMVFCPVGHDHHHHHHDSGSALRRAFLLNLAFTIIEIIGGILTNSVAILSDAVHDLGDSLSLGLALGSERVARVRPATARATYGYRRLTLLSSLINALVLTGGSVFILTQAIPRLWNPEAPHQLGMIGLAVLGVVVNGLAVVTTRRGKSLNERVVSLHLLEDVLGWLAVLIGAIVMRLTGWNWIDPLLAVGISGYILLSVVRRLREIVSLLLQGAPREVDVEGLEREIVATPAIESVHHLHVWSLDGEHHVLTVHAVLRDASDEAAYREAKVDIREIATRHGFDHVTVELEFADEACAMR